MSASLKERMRRSNSSPPSRKPPRYCFVHRFCTLDSCLIRNNGSPIILILISRDLISSTDGNLISRFLKCPTKTPRAYKIGVTKFGAGVCLCSPSRDKGCLICPCSFFVWHKRAARLSLRYESATGQIWRNRSRGKTLHA
jgi:hypothetical protein